jgi:hypothetical protein
MRAPGAAWRRLRGGVIQIGAHGGFVRTSSAGVLRAAISQTGLPGLYPPEGGANIRLRERSGGLSAA